MSEVTMIGLDIAKHVFHAHGVDASLPCDDAELSQRSPAELAAEPRPWTEIVVKITPGCAGARDSERPAQQAAMIRGRAAPLASGHHHEGLKERPLLVLHKTVNQDRPPKATLESRFGRAAHSLAQ